MAQLGAAAKENRRSTFVGVSVGDLGVHVHNHVYEPTGTGLPFSVELDRVVIEMKRENYGALTYSASHRNQDTKFTPKRSHRLSHEEQVLVRDPSTDQTDIAEPALDGNKDDEDNVNSREIVTAGVQLGNNDDDEAQEKEKLIPRDGSGAQLAVQNWVANEQKEVLVY